VAATLLYVFPPEQHAWYPRCAFYTVTGYKCPGCGGLRAMHSLLHGDFAAAFRNNAFFMILGPGVIIGYGFFAIFRRLNRPIPAFIEHPVWLWLILVAAIAFGVVRNIH
jgi:hypothetical protein